MRSFVSLVPRSSKCTFHLLLELYRWYTHTRHSCTHYTPPLWAWITRIAPHTDCEFNFLKRKKLDQRTMNQTTLAPSLLDQSLWTEHDHPCDAHVHYMCPLPARSIAGNRTRSPMRCTRTLYVPPPCSFVRWEQNKHDDERVKIVVSVMSIYAIAI